MLLVLFGILALAFVAIAQEEFYHGESGDDVEVSASNIASSLGIDGSTLYEDLLRIRDQVVPLAEQYSNSNNNNNNN